MNVFTRIAILMTFLVPSSFAYGAGFFGRMEVGGFLSQESLSTPFAGSSTNDGQTLSSRFYLRVYKMTPSDLETVLDVRDKSDFFGQLNRQTQQLISSNQPQVYQLNVKLHNTGSAFYASLGRFSLPEAGGVFTDGADVGWRWDRSWRTSLFGGFNPKRWDQTAVTFNSDSMVFGSYLKFQPTPQDLDQNTYWSSAWVSNLVQGHLDRLYWYNNWIYQWSTPNQFMAMIYMDFVPNPLIQSALVSYHQDWNMGLITDLNLLAIDVIEYSRSQGILETLTSSPYREGSLNFRYALGGDGFWDTKVSYGARQVDGLDRAEVLVGPSFYHLVNDHANSKIQVGLRDNFNTSDVFTQLGFNYFSNLWEFDLSANYVFSRLGDSSILHRWVGEILVTRYFSREFLAAVSLQEAQDEIIQAWSGYFRLSYTFGQRDLSPVPDVAPAPPLGTLRRL